MTAPKAGIRQSNPPLVVPRDPVPRRPKVSGLPRNGLPELKPYVYGESRRAKDGTEGEYGSAELLTAPAAEGYECRECHGQAMTVDGIVRPVHEDGCPVGDRVRSLLRSAQ